jgi:hypothetical protein
MGSPDRDDGFGAFFKRYTKTWQHAVATAGLTAFGMLTFVNRLFAVLAILAYVLPPVVLYVRGSRPAATGDRPASGADRPTDGDGNGSGSEADRGSGPAAGSGGDPAGDRSSEGGDREPGWTAASVPTEQTLLDAAAVGGHAYAVGAEGAVLATDGDEWDVAVAEGPRAQSNALRGVDAVAGGGVWFAGDGGAVGRLDPDTGRHADHSAPDGDTTNLAGVAAAGSPGDETILLVDGSGRVRRGRYRSGEVAWDRPLTPGSGSSLAGVALPEASVGYACDTSQRVYETDDGGQTFDDLELEAADGTLTDVAATGPGDCAVSADDGVLHRYDGGTWTPERLGDGPVWALALAGGRGLASGDGETVYQRLADGAEWERAVTPADGALRGVAVGSTRAVAVGEDGTVVERAFSASSTADADGA